MLSKKKIEESAIAEHKKIRYEKDDWISQIGFVKGFRICYNLFKKGKLRC